MYSCAQMQEQHQQHQQHRASEHPAPRPARDTRTSQPAGTDQATGYYRTKTSMVHHSQNVYFTSVSPHGRTSNWQSPAGSHRSAVSSQRTTGMYYNHTQRRQMPKSPNTMITMQSGNNAGYPAPYQYYYLGNVIAKNDLNSWEPAHGTAVSSTAAYNGQTAQNNVCVPNSGQQQTFYLTHAPNGYTAGSQSFVDNNNAVHSPNGQSLGVSDTSQKAQASSAQPSSWCNYKPPATTASSQNSPNSQYSPANFQGSHHHLSAAPVVQNMQTVDENPAVPKLHMSVSGGNCTSSSTSPTAASSRSLPPPPLYRDQHVITQQSVSKDASVSHTQPASNAASGGSMLRTMLSDPDPPGPSSGTAPETTQQFQGATPPQQSAGANVPSDTSTGAVQRSQANATRSSPEKFEKMVSVLLQKVLKRLVDAKQLHGTNDSETSQTTKSPSSAAPNDSSYQVPPGCLGNRAVAVVQPLLFECLQQMSQNNASGEGFTISDKGSVSPDVDSESPEQNTSGAESSPVGGSTLVTALLASDVGEQKSSHASDCSVDAEAPAQNPETSESPGNEVPGEEDASSEASPGPSVASSPLATSENAGETDVEKNKTSSGGLTKLYFLKEDEVYKEPPYKSVWLNTNEQLDDIDKEFGFPWTLTHPHHKLDSGDKPSDVERAPPAPVCETSNQVSLQPTPADTDAKSEASPPQTSSPSDSEMESSAIKLEVLSPEEAQRIFEQIQAGTLATLVTDGDEGAPPSQSDEECCLAASMEKPCGLTVGEILNQVSNTEGDEPKKRQNPSKDCPARGHDQKAPTVSTDDHQADIIIIDSDNESLTEVAGPEITSEPEEVCAAPSQSCTLNCDDQLNEKEEEGQVSVPEDVCEPAQLESAVSTESPLETEATQTPSSSSVTPEKQKTANSAGSLQSIKILQERKEPVVGAQRVSNSDQEETPLNAANAQQCQGSSPKPRKAKLMLYGSANETQFVSPGKKVSCLGCMSDRRAPRILSISLDPLSRPSGQTSPTKPGHVWTSSVKQRIHERWRESFTLPQVCRKPKRSSSPENPKKRTTKRERSPTDEVLDSTKEHHWRLKRHKHEEEGKKDLDSVRKSSTKEKSEAEVERCKASPAFQENSVLKFSVLPQTFKFREESKERTDASVSEKKDDSVNNPNLGKEQDSKDSKAALKMKDWWIMVNEDSSARQSILKKCNIFELQKNNWKNKQPAKQNSQS